MHTGFVMIPENIKSQSTAITVAQGKQLPAVINNSSTALICL